MFRNQYDTDVTLWSPAGRIHQIEYAMEAVKQGSAAVGARSNRHVVLAALKRAPSELSSHQKKMFRIDDHIGMVMAGLTADGRVLCRYMRKECIEHHYVFDSSMNVGRLVKQVADKSQLGTQRSWKRPYGVGMLVAGYDSTGAHLYQTCPSGNYFEFYAMAIGARSQAAKTYLERNYEGFPECTLDDLIKHALKALKESVVDGELTTKNCSLCYLGEDTAFTLVENEALEPLLSAIIPEEETQAEDPPQAEEQGAQPMDSS